MSTPKTTASRRWTSQEDQLLSEQVQNYKGTVNWVVIAQAHRGRSNKDCRNRWMKIKCRWSRGVWTEEENERLSEAISAHGYNWTSVSEAVGSRSPDQCSKHWTNSLDPQINHGGWTVQEDHCLMDAVHVHGRAWKQIAGRYFPNRSTLEISNRYNLKYRKTEQSDLSNPGNTEETRPTNGLGGNRILDMQACMSSSMQETCGVGVDPHDTDINFRPFPMCLDQSSQDFSVDSINSNWDTDFTPTYLEGNYLHSIDSLDKSHGLTFNHPTPEASISCSSTPRIMSGSLPFSGEEGEPQLSSYNPYSATGQRPTRVQRTSFTMENLDSETRNEILDILCRRKVMTTIDIS